MPCLSIKSKTNLSSLELVLYIGRQWLINIYICMYTIIRECQCVLFFKGYESNWKNWVMHWTIRVLTSDANLLVAKNKRRTKFNALPNRNVFSIQSDCYLSSWRKQWSQCLKAFIEFLTPFALWDHMVQLSGCGAICLDTCTNSQII